MNNAVQIVNPVEDAYWNELILADKNCSFFHSSNWAQVLSESYAYTPRYFLNTHDSKILALIPLMEVDSRITGRRAVSLPFTDYCDPIITECTQLGDLLNTVTNYGKKSKWRSFELRTTSALPSVYSPSSNYCGHVLDISRDEGEIFIHLRDSTRRNIEKALKKGVTINFCDSLDTLKEFYRLNCITRRVHGLPPQPYNFFKKIYEYVLSKGLGHIVLASYNGKYIAGAVFFHFGDKALYKFGASDKKYLELRANNLVMWEAIRWYRNNGYASFSFGRTETENGGLLQFKRGWGAKEYPIYYYKYDLRQNEFVNDALKLRGGHNRIFKRMPLPLLKMAGTLLYRHMA